MWQYARIARRGINEILATAQGRLQRLTPAETASAVGQGAVLVDTRDGELRTRDGIIPGSVHIPLSVLEWRVDPSSGHQGAELGFARTTDVIGGFVAWAAEGLPVER